MKQTNNNRLDSGWLLSETEPGKYTSPAELQQHPLNWIPATVPGTVAQAYQNAHVWSLNNHFDFDSKDWWYQTQFAFSANTTSPVLNLNGLATLCDVWLNNQLILSSENMFIAHQLDVAEYLEPSNELVLCFRSLTNHLSQRRPRPRWKTKLVNQQQLRWIRTTLLGRIPGWTPPVAPVGPWQPIYFTNKTTPTNINVTPSINTESATVDFSCQLPVDDDSSVKATLNIDSNSTNLNIDKTTHGYRISGQLNIKNVKLWWPHTHGVPKLYLPELSLTINNKTENHTLPAIGFKTVQVDQSNNNFHISVNGQSIFCRGACWTINDIISLQGDNHSLEQTLTLMRDAGANMLRIGGTMIYEQDYFYQLCDQLGIMVWQDFMFANMDYPIDNSDFQHSVNTEIQQTLTRLRQHVCVSTYCGNSEIEQQTAMLGLSNSETENSLFTQLIPELCHKLHPNIPYITSTPTGDSLPFHTNKSVSHYYGVGAYQRPVSELRQHNVKFTSECLGFANIPVTETRNQVLDGQLPVTHHPKWKQRTPRDTGTGWDFEDVRDHYTQALFGIDPVNSRSYNSEQYLSLSELSTGEIMAQVFSEWRSTHSQCAGGLVWFLKDFWAGAGWGIIDSEGLPKACYYYLKRCWQPVNVVITDESLNGLDFHIINESSETLQAQLEVSILTQQSTEIAREAIDISLEKNSTTTINSDKILKRFYDVTYSYRFGPAKHNVVAAQLKNKQANTISNAFYFPESTIPYCDPNAKLSAIAKQITPDHYELELSCNRFLYAVNIDVNGYRPSNNFFHMLPNTITLVTMKRTTPDTKKYKGYVGALNLTDEIKIKVSPQ